ncbi:MAG: hypothetical protein L3J89_06690 [Gammaproteobacteria bacterium]|nr:hypothetical protein [Gammaproteobacteria bacterium]
MNKYITKTLTQEFPVSKSLNTFLFLICLFFLINTTTANARYEVFFDGGGINAGSIVVSNDAAPVPDGVCGMSINGVDLLAFHWTEYNEYNLGSPMPAPPLGPPSDAEYDFPGEALEGVIRFTGPLSDNCEDEWVFQLPLTGAWPVLPNGTPSGAGALVFQTIDVVWLDESFQIWVPADDGPGSQEDPEFPSFCEVWPDLCGDPEFTAGPGIDVFCFLHPQLCDVAEEFNIIGSVIKKNIQLVIKELNINTVVSARNATERLIRAKSAAIYALQSTEKFNFNNIKEVKSGILHNANAQLDTTIMALRSCVSTIEKMQSTIKNRTEKALSSDFFANSTHEVIYRCKAAVISLAQVKNQLQQMPHHFISTNKR